MKGCVERITIYFNFKRILAQVTFGKSVVTYLSCSPSSKGGLSNSNQAFSSGTVGPETFFKVTGESFAIS